MRAVFNCFFERLIQFDWVLCPPVGDLYFAARCVTSRRGWRCMAPYMWEVLTSSRAARCIVVIVSLGVTDGGCLLKGPSNNNAMGRCPVNYPNGICTRTCRNTENVQDTKTTWKPYRIGMGIYIYIHHISAIIPKRQHMNYVRFWKMLKTCLKYV